MLAIARLCSLPLASAFSVNAPLSRKLANEGPHCYYYRAYYVGIDCEKSLDLVGIAINKIIVC